MSYELKKGKLLISTIGLSDPNFQHTAVLLCDYGPQQGAYGLILNRRIEIPSELKAQAPYTEGNLFQGGPVQPGNLQILHPYGHMLTGAVDVVDGVWLGAEFQSLESSIASGVCDPDECRFFLGYSGWSAEQLEAEIEQNAWVVVNATPDLIWDTAPESLWGAAVRSQKASDPLFKNFPEHPSMN